MLKEKFYLLKNQLLRKKIEKIEKKIEKQIKKDEIIETIVLKDDDNLNIEWESKIFNN